MQKQCTNAGGTFIQGVCSGIADIYHGAVKNYGDDAFKNAKPGDTPIDWDYEPIIVWP
jgi:hypothetical protein